MPVTALFNMKPPRSPDGRKVYPCGVVQPHKVPVPCDRCGTVALKWPQQIYKKRSLGRLLFCSNKCAGESRRTSSEVACTGCSKPVRRENHSLKRKVGVFCSQKCYWEARSRLLSGKNSPNWRGGSTMDYGGSNWKSQRRRALKRDGHQCRGCRATKQSHGYRMDVHHIVSYHRYKDKKRANRLENLLTLCRPCHAKKHPRRGRRKRPISHR